MTPDASTPRWRLAREPRLVGCGSPFGKRSVLLTRDAEWPVEDDLIESGLLRPVTLLKVGHNGRKTSSSEEFLSQLRSRLAVLSDGYKNQFHVRTPPCWPGIMLLFWGPARLIMFRTDGDKVEYENFR